MTKKTKPTNGDEAPETRHPIIKVLDVEHVAAGHRKKYLSKKNLTAIVEAANAEQGIPLYLGEAFDDDGDALANSDEPIGMLVKWTNQWDEWLEAVLTGATADLVEKIVEGEWSLHAMQLILPLDDAGKRLADDPNLEALASQVKATNEMYGDRLKAIDKELSDLAAEIIAGGDDGRVIAAMNEQRQALDTREEVRDEYLTAKRRLKLIVDAKAGAVAMLEEELRTREEWRRVSVETRRDVGAKELYDIRLDTGAEIPGTRRAMSAEEQQLPLEGGDNE